MLFNSYGFIFLYLPVTLLVFFFLGKSSRRLAATWLTAASLFFYGYWNPAYIGLLLASIFFNYSVGVALAKNAAERADGKRRWVLLFGIGANLALLGYYKYANFFLGILDAAGAYRLEGIILPLGISFFTFTQIAFLVDAYRGIAREFNFIHYSLFVTYFPHLIAGPVLHHKEMMPQFADPHVYKPRYDNLSVGATIFILGLFKKTVLADGIAVNVSPVFDAAAHGQSIAFFDAWVGALSYSFQLYFDFSGYSDMAIGLSRLFGVRLPLNFHSPYKAVNIIDFWRRWHMTLSRFLRDYLYIPLGGNRKGPLRRYANLLTVMLLGGLWHGAGWTFIAWGGLHGIYLAANHGWRALREWLGHDLEKTSRIGALLSGALTFLAVVAAWVFFRAASVEAGLDILASMAGANGFDLHKRLVKQTYEFREFISLFIVVWLLPNTQEFMARFQPALDFCGPSDPAPRWSWRPTPLWAVAVFTMAVAALTQGQKVSEFLYFQF